MDDETLFSQCPVVSGCVISFLVFYRNLFLYYYYYYYYYYYCYYYCYYYYYFFFFFFLLGCGLVELSSGAFMSGKILYSASSLVASFCPGCSLFVVFFKFWTFGLSSRICDLFIRHSLWTTVALAGFSSRPRPVFPLGQPPLLGF